MSERKKTDPLGSVSFAGWSTEAVIVVWEVLLRRHDYDYDRATGVVSWDERLAVAITEAAKTEIVTRAAGKAGA